MPPSNKSQIDASFSKQIEKLASYAKSCADAILGSDDTKWYTPEDWQQDPVANNDAIDYQAFNRDSISDAMRDTIQDPQNPGTVADLNALILQNEWLGSCSRAYRMRHQTKTQAWIHAANRYRAHGADWGLWVGVQKEIIKQILKAGADNA